MAHEFGAGHNSRGYALDIQSIFSLWFTVNLRSGKSPALIPVPVMGTVRIVSSFGLVTVSVALRGDGHWAGGVPGAQVSCGAKATVTTQDWPEPSSKGCPCAGTPPGPQVSVSV